MSIIQGVENVDVPIPMRALESKLVGEKERELIAKLNSEGKRVVKIDHQKRAGGFGEWSETHATITALWEADTEDPNYKSYTNRQRAQEEQLRKQKQVIEQQYREKQMMKAALQRQETIRKADADTKQFWEKHKKERLELSQELEWLKGLSSEEIGNNEKYVKDRIQIIFSILNRERLGQKEFTKYENVQLLYGNTSKIRLTNPSKYNEIITQHPILANVTDLEAGKETTFLKTIRTFLWLFPISAAPIILFIYMRDKWEEAYDIIGFLALGFLSLCGIFGVCGSIIMLFNGLINTTDTKTKYRPYIKELKKVNKDMEKSTVVKEFKDADKRAESIKRDIVHEEISVQQNQSLPKNEQMAISYQEAIQLMREGKYDEAYNAFAKLDGYKDSANIMRICTEYANYEAEEKKRKTEKMNQSLLTDEQMAISYQEAIQLMREGKYDEAYNAFAKLDGYKDSANIMRICTEYANYEAEEMNRKKQN